MKRSALNLVSALKSKLLEFPGIVSSLEKKEIFFIEKLFMWINNTEEILTTYNISEVSEISGLRSKIISPKFSNNKSISIKKAQLKIASEILYELQNTVLKVLKPFELKVEECRELVRQLLLIVGQTKAIKYNSDFPFENLVNDVWQFIVSNEQLKAGAIKLKTNLPITDIQIIIAEELNLEDF